MPARAWLLVAILGVAACGGADDDRSTAPIVLPEPEQTGDAPSEDEPSEDAPGGDEPELVVSDDACTSDADCVPAECCHAAACVGRSNAPACGDAMCTMECRYGTLDCGGGCLCHEGRCAARLSQPPEEPEAE